LFSILFYVKLELQTARYIGNLSKSKSTKFYYVFEAIVLYNTKTKQQILKRLLFKLKCRDYMEDIMIKEESAEELESKLVSITEAAKLNKVTRQAIYVAIKLNKLRARKETTRWTIHLDDLENYRKQKYSRSKSTFNGELLYDNTKGYFSVNQVAKMLSIPAQKIYYATRIGKLQAHRKGSAWVIHEEDFRVYAEGIMKKKTRKAG
jgi:excisionase family DNA binding protein